MATLRKGDMTARVAAKLEGPRAQGEAALNATLDAIREELAAGNRVVLTGFGSFEIRQVGERRVKAIRGGRAGELIKVPAHKRIGFNPGSVMRAAARG